MASAIAATGVLGDRNRGRFKALASKRFSGVYRYMLSHYKNPESLVLGSKEPLTIFDGHAGDEWDNLVHQ